MSKNKNSKTLGAVMGGRSADQISPDEAMVFALASNMMAIALADIPDAKERVMRARHQLLLRQSNVTIGKRRQIEGVESYVLDAIKHMQANTPTIH